MLAFNYELKAKIDKIFKASIASRPAAPIPFLVMTSQNGKLLRQVVKISGFGEFYIFIENLLTN
jgi:hypothetical protein